MLCVCRSEDLLESFFFFYHVLSRDVTQVVRLGTKNLHLLCHLSALMIWYRERMI